MLICVDEEKSNYFVVFKIIEFSNIVYKIFLYILMQMINKYFSVRFFGELYVINYN